MEIVRALIELQISGDRYSLYKYIQNDLEAF